MLEATLAYGMSRQTTMRRAKRGELNAVYLRTGRRKGQVSKLLALRLLSICVLNKSVRFASQNCGQVNTRTRARHRPLAVRPPLWGRDSVSSR